MTPTVILSRAYGFGGALLADLSFSALTRYHLGGQKLEFPALDPSEDSRFTIYWAQALPGPLLTGHNPIHVDRLPDC